MLFTKHNTKISIVSAIFLVLAISLTISMVIIPASAGGNVTPAFNVTFSPDESVISSRLDRVPVFRANVSEVSDVVWYLDNYQVVSYTDICNSSYVPAVSETGNYSIKVHVSNPNGSIENQWYWLATPTPSQIISGGSSSSSSSSGSVSSGEDYKNILVKEVNMQILNKNVLTEFTFTEDNNPISSLEFTSSVNAGYVRMSLEVLSDRSSFVSEDPDDEVYCYVNINPDRTGLDNKIGDTRIFFNVSQQWLDDNNIDADSVRLKLFGSYGWKTFPVKIISGSNSSENSNLNSNVTFVSTTTGFGSFAITGKVNKSSEDDVVVIDMGGDSSKKSSGADSGSKKEGGSSDSENVLDSVLRSMKELFIKRNPVNT
nr:PGF-pre-PGF domain-containing protein [uncultured Methanolobus sp.]